MLLSLAIPPFNNTTLILLNPANTWKLDIDTYVLIQDTGYSAFGPGTWT
jgi:hypothetical protein